MRRGVSAPLAVARRLPPSSDFSISASRSKRMRGLSLIDVLVILAVLALLVLAGSKDFVRYDGRTVAPPPTATPQPAS